MKKNEMTSSYKEEVKKFKESNSSFSSREELDSFFKKEIEKEGGIEALIGERNVEVLQLLNVFRLENDIKPGEILEAMKYLRLYVLTKI